MTFWIYENWQAGPHKAVVHLGSCGFCNEGKGMSDGEYDPGHGRWHGPFETLRDAQARAKALSGVVNRRNHSCVMTS